VISNKPVVSESVQIKLNTDMLLHRRELHVAAFLLLPLLPVLTFANTNFQYPLDTYNGKVSETPVQIDNGQGVVSTINMVEFKCGGTDHFPKTQDYTLNTTHPDFNVPYDIRVSCNAPIIRYNETLIGYVPPAARYYTVEVIIQSNSEQSIDGQTGTQFSLLSGSAKRLSPDNKMWGGTGWLRDNHFTVRCVLFCTSVHTGGGGGITQSQVEAWINSNKKLKAALQSIDTLFQDEKDINSRVLNLFDATNRIDRTFANITRGMQTQLDAHQQAISIMDNQLNHFEDVTNANWAANKNAIDSLGNELQTGLTFALDEVRWLRGNVSREFLARDNRTKLVIDELVSNLKDTQADLLQLENWISATMQAAVAARHANQIRQRMSIAYHYLLERAQNDGFHPFLEDLGTAPVYDPNDFDGSNAIYLIEEFTVVTAMDTNPATGVSPQADCSDACNPCACNYRKAVAVEWRYEVYCNIEYMLVYSHGRIGWNEIKFHFASSQCTLPNPTTNEILDSADCKCWVVKKLVSTCDTDSWPRTTDELALADGQLTDGSPFCTTTDWTYVGGGGGSPNSTSLTNVQSFVDNSAYHTTMTTWQEIETDLIALCTQEPSIRFASPTNPTYTAAWGGGYIDVGYPQTSGDVLQQMASTKHGKLKWYQYGHTSCSPDKIDIIEAALNRTNPLAIWAVIMQRAWTTAYQIHIPQYQTYRYGTMGTGVTIHEEKSTAQQMQAQRVFRISFVATPQGEPLVPVYLVEPEDVIKSTTLSVLSPPGQTLDYDAMPSFIEGDFSFLIPQQHVRIGKAKCAGGSGDADCDYLNYPSGTAYTFDVPTTVLSTADGPGLNQLMAPAHFTGDWNLTAWKALKNQSTFDAARAAYSLEEYYTPLNVFRFCDKNSIQVSSQWCTQLSKFYWDTSCTGSSGTDICLQFRQWSMRTQFSLPYGSYTQVRALGCPEVSVTPGGSGSMTIGLRNVDNNNETETVTYEITSDYDPLCAVAPTTTLIGFGETKYFTLAACDANHELHLRISTGGRLCSVTNLTFAGQSTELATRDVTTQISNQVFVTQDSSVYLGAQLGAIIQSTTEALYQTIRTELLKQGVNLGNSNITAIIAGIQRGVAEAVSQANFTLVNDTTSRTEVTKALNRAAVAAEQTKASQDKIDTLIDDQSRQVQGLNESVNKMSRDIDAAHTAIRAAEDALDQLNAELEKGTFNQACGVDTLFSLCTFLPVLVTLVIIAIFAALWFIIKHLFRIGKRVATFHMHTKPHTHPPGAPHPASTKVPKKPPATSEGQKKQKPRPLQTDAARKRVGSQLARFNGGSDTGTWS
jgi:outer membrane murein-binding lipoprotein Lpp